MKKIILAGLLVSSVCFANRESGGRNQASAVYVDFKSFGAGIDSVTLNIFESLVANATAQGQVVDLTAEPMGREGETLRCVDLQDAQQRYYFIQSLAPSILADTQQVGSQRSAVYVGTDCHSFESATEQDLNQYPGMMK